jgi:hypothetical protein
MRSLMAMIVDACPPQPLAETVANSPGFFPGLFESTEKVMD